MGSVHMQWSVAFFRVKFINQVVADIKPGCIRVEWVDGGLLHDCWHSSDTKLAEKTTGLGAWSAYAAGGADSSHESGDEDEDDEAGGGGGGEDAVAVGGHGDDFFMDEPVGSEDGAEDDGIDEEAAGVDGVAVLDLLEGGGVGGDVEACFLFEDVDSITFVYPGLGSLVYYHRVFVLYILHGTDSQHQCRWQSQRVHCTHVANHVQEEKSR